MVTVFKSAWVGIAVCTLVVGCGEPNTGDTDAMQERAAHRAEQSPNIAGSEIKEFAPGVISTPAREFATSFSPDGNTVYFNRKDDDDPDYHIWHAERSGDIWRPAKKIAFSKTGYADLDPFVSRSGDRLYFSSDRPLPDSTSIDPTPDTNTWYAPRTDGGWGEPVYAGNVVNSSASETFVSETENGTLVFTRFGEGEGRGRPAYLMMADRNGDAFENLRYVKTFPVAGRVTNPAISPDGKLIIAAGRTVSGIGPRLYFARKVTAAGAETWSQFHPVPGLAAGTRTVDFAPYIANDGQTLYFGSDRASEGKRNDNIFVTRLSDQVLKDDAPIYGPATGSLIIAGGGRLEGSGIIERFIELGGGAEDGTFVIVPTARGNFLDDGTPRQFDAEQMLEYWRGLGMKNVHMLHTHDPDVANTDAFIEPLINATGVWFMGGRQWNIVDSYAGTKTYAAFHAVLERGGVIAGSSAGATIQGEYLVRGDTKSPDIIMTEETNHQLGFEFLSRAAIDQHVDTRDRWEHIVPLMKAQPHLLGFGLSEATALEVHGDVATIIGVGKVAIHDNSRAYGPEDKPYIVAGPGDIFLMDSRTLQANGPN